MGEKGNVASAVSGGSGLLEGALDTGKVVVERGTDIVVEGASGAVTGVVNDKVRDTFDRDEPDEPDDSDGRPSP